MIKTWTHDKGKKIKLFISQPYTGQNPEDIKHSRKCIHWLMKSIIGELKVELLNQFDMGDPYDIDENFSCEEQREAYRFCRSIGIMKDADVVVMFGDWEKSRGCTIEHLIAEKYNIPIFDISKYSTMNKSKTFHVGVCSSGSGFYVPGYLYVAEDDDRFTDGETIKCFHYPCTQLMIKELKIKKFTFLKAPSIIITNKDASDMCIDFGYDLIDIIKENTESIQTDKSLRDIIYDVMYKHIKPKLDKNVEMGGYSINGSDSELFYWALKDPSLDYYHNLGSRLFKDGNCWKIYSGHHMVEHYNIIVHFNDNDKITNVEWIEDSRFNPFNKEFMYSIYEDLKKYEIPKPSKDDTEEFDEPTDEEINETIKECYPFCIIKDRHSGTYSGGEYTAWACGIDFIPEGIFGDDFDCVRACACAGAWEKLRRQRKNGEIVYGVGNTPDEASKDLARAIIINNKKIEEE